jgi:hypothetical protein
MGWPNQPRPSLIVASRRAELGPCQARGFTGLLASASSSCSTCRLLLRSLLVRGAGPRFHRAGWREGRGGNPLVSSVLYPPALESDPKPPATAPHPSWPAAILGRHRRGPLGADETNGLRHGPPVHARGPRAVHRRPRRRCRRSESAGRWRAVSGEACVTARGGPAIRGPEARGRPRRRGTLRARRPAVLRRPPRKCPPASPVVSADAQGPAHCARERRRRRRVRKRKARGGGGAATAACANEKSLAAATAGRMANSDAAGRRQRRTSKT